MASNREYLEYVLEQLSLLEDISYRPMMGEYIIYFKGRIIGGIYDNRFLIKPSKAVMKLIPEARRELPYEGAKEMLLVEDLEDREFLSDLIDTLYTDLASVDRKKKGK